MNAIAMQTTHAKAMRRYGHARPFAELGGISVSVERV